ncbi:hypothetical protein [Novosphingobium sp. MMS21-SN21R]|uniref:hypothetical protein n=1 Tax=Novosphingobium sp. MMS21-SN21R TaxID=2969298 RepID=UPI0028844387|nr:hypothetical protein [Novosphingobium sp. MMS21-SN21R]MDT0507509.1 hypothetical protein [Novosphingobium sp. MMS21-SN21R]
MSEAILNQPWEDVADDVTGAIEKAVQPLLKKAVDDIYSGLLDATQDYLRDNVAFNIASRISTSDREAADARQRYAELSKSHEALLELAYQYASDLLYPPTADSRERRLDRIAAVLAKAGVAC